IGEDEPRRVENESGPHSARHDAATTTEHRLFRLNEDHRGVRLRGEVGERGRPTLDAPFVGTAGRKWGGSRGGLRSRWRSGVLAVLTGATLAGDDAHDD